MMDLPSSHEGDSSSLVVSSVFCLDVLATCLSWRSQGWNYYSLSWSLALKCTLILCRGALCNVRGYRSTLDQFNWHLTMRVSNDNFSCLKKSYGPMLRTGPFRWGLRRLKWVTFWSRRNKQISPQFSDARRGGDSGGWKSRGGGWNGGVMDNHPGSKGLNVNEQLGYLDANMFWGSKSC